MFFLQFVIKVVIRLYCWLFMLLFQVMYNHSMYSMFYLFYSQAIKFRDLSINIVSKVGFFQRFLQRTKRCRGRYSTIYHATSQWFIRNNTHLSFWHNVKKKTARLKLKSCQFDLLWTLYSLYLHVRYNFYVKGCCSYLTSLSLMDNGKLTITLRCLDLSKQQNLIADEAKNTLHVV